jgi:hypothetical protein
MSEIDYTIEYNQQSNISSSRNSEAKNISYKIRESIKKIRSCDETIIEQITEEIMEFFEFHEKMNENIMAIALIFVHTQGEHGDLKLYLNSVGDMLEKLFKSDEYNPKTDLVKMKIDIVKYVRALIRMQQ